MCGGSGGEGVNFKSGSTLFAIDASTTFQQTRKADNFCCDLGIKG